MYYALTCWWCGLWVYWLEEGECRQQPVCYLMVSQVKVADVVGLEFGWNEGGVYHILEGSLKTFLMDQF